jgi:DNA-binding CsgD family transcriptional regulator
MGVLLNPLNPDALEQAAQGLMSLTQSEYLVLRALFAGLTSNEIAEETGLTKLTVQFYLKTIFRKCHSDRLTLARMAAKLEQNPAVSRYLASLDIMAGPRGRHSGKLASSASSGKGSLSQTPAVDTASVVQLKTRTRVAERRPFKPRRKLAKSA